MSKELIVPNKVFLLNDNGAEKFIKTNEDGSIKSMLKNVRLSMREGQIYKIPGGKNAADKWQITAEGYSYLNRFAGLEILKEDTIKIGNDEFIPNPYVVLDAKGKKSKVWSKTSVAGRGPNGQFRISTATIMYDTEDGFITDILNKIKWDKEKKLGRVCTETVANVRIEKGDNVIWFPINDIMGVLLNLDHDGALQAIINYQNNKDVIDRKLQTMSLRNAIKKHPAVAIATVDPKPVENGDMICYVPIVMWLDDITDEEKQMIEEYKEGVNVVSDIEPDDLSEPTEEGEIIEVEEEELKPAEETKEKEKEEKELEELKELKANLVEGLNIIGQDEFEEILRSKGVDIAPIDEMNKKQLNWCITVINNALESEEEENNDK